MSELDYDGIMNKARDQAEAEAKLLYPDHLEDLRKKAVQELTLKYFRQMYYPQR